MAPNKGAGVFADDPFSLPYDCPFCGGQDGHRLRCLTCGGSGWDPATRFRAVQQQGLLLREVTSLLRALALHLGVALPQHPEIDSARDNGG